MLIDTSKLVGAEGLLVALFDEGHRPSLRWLKMQVAARNIPAIKVGRLVFFDVGQVREALAKRNTIKAR